MRFDDFYEFLEPVPMLNTEVDYSFTGRDQTSKVKVYIHLLARSKETENLALLAKVPAMPIAYRERVLRIGSVAGFQYLVTDSPIRAIRKWLAAKPDAGEPTIIAPISGFRSAQVPVPAIAVPVVTKVVPQVVEKPPGEFTQMFSAPQLAAHPVDLAPLPMELPQKEAGPTLGQFRLGMDAGEKSSAGALPSSNQSEFSRIFKPEGGSNATLESKGKAGLFPAIQTMPSAPQAIHPSPSEFTMLMKSRDSTQPEAAAAPLNSPKAMPQAQPGEFTSLFRSNPGLPEASPIVPSDSKVHMVGLAEAGEFTMLLQPHGINMVPAAPVIQQQTPVVELSKPFPKVAVPDPEVTRMFSQTAQAQPILPMEMPLSQRSEGASAGEFTRAFQSPPPQPQEPKPPAPASVASANVQPQPGLGEFTQMMKSPMNKFDGFGTVGSAPLPAVPRAPTPQKSSGEFTSMFGPGETPLNLKPPSFAPSMVSGGEATNYFPASRPQPTAPPLAHASEYTSMFEASTPPPAAVAPTPVTTPKKTQQLHLFIALGVLFLLAVIIIVLFAVRG